MAREAVKAALEKAKKGGIRNILALRGDPPKGMETWEAVRLVKWLNCLCPRSACSHATVWFDGFNVLLV